MRINLLVEKPEGIMGDVSARGRIILEWIL